MKYTFNNAASVLSDSELFLFHLSVYTSSVVRCGLAFLSLNKPGTGQIPSLNIIISGFLCDLRKTTLFPYNHTNKTTYFLKHQGQKHFKTRAGSFSGNLPNYSGIIISINSSTFTSVDTPSEWRQQFCSKGWIPQQILSINYHPSKDIAIPLHLHIWSCFQYLPTDFEWVFLIWGGFVLLCCSYDNNSDLFICKTIWESSPKKVHQF